MNLELLRDDVSVTGLAPAWEALWRRVPEATPFQHPAWLLPWWNAFGTGAPRVAVLHDGGTLAGVLPLYDLPDERKILPFGAGLTDYQDVLLAPGLPAGAAAALLRTALAGSRFPCHLTDLPHGAALRDAATPHGWHAQTSVSDPCPVLLPETVPPLQRRKLRMARHRADRLGGWMVDDEDPEALFETLAVLHGARWRARDEQGVLADPRVLAFHREAIPKLAADGLLRLRGVRIGGEVAAVIHGMAAGGRLFLYLGGFDAAYAYASPGTILLGAMIGEYREIHMLRGAEAYKYAWGAADRWSVQRILTPS